MLLAAVVGSGIMAERLAGGNVAIALLANTIATGAALVALILTFGPVSGAHLNPAVTIADASQGGLRWSLVPGYIVAQLVGAYAGVLAAHLMFGERVFMLSLRERSGTAQMLSEFVATFGLLAVIWGCSRRRSADRAVRRRGLHYIGVLVHGIDVVRESSRHSRACLHGYVCRNPPGRRSGIRHFPSPRRPNGHAAVSVAGSNPSSKRR